MNYRVLCSVLLGGSMLACVPPSVASTDVHPTIYISKLPLAGSSSMVEGEHFQFFCTPDHRPVAAADLTKLKSCSDGRIDSTRGEEIDVTYVYATPDASCPTTPPPVPVVVTIHEKSRSTAFGAETKTVFTALVSGTAKSPQRMAELFAARTTTPQFCTTATVYDLTLERATADVTLSLTSTSDALTSFPLVTGPREHWFITGDAIVRGVKEIKYDPGQKTVVERDKPKQLYIGFNWMYGDVLSKAPQFSADRLVGKILISPTKNPFDSVGVGIGYRLVDGVFKRPVGDSMNAPDISGGLVVFVGRFWTKPDMAGAPDDADARHRWQAGVRFGLSYDVSTLLGWLN